MSNQFRKTRRARNRGEAPVKKIFLFEPMYDKIEKIAKENDVDTVAMIHDILMQAVGNYEQAKAAQDSKKDSMIVVPKGGMGEVHAKIQAHDKQ